MAGTTLVFEGVEATAEYTRHGDRICGGVRFPSGKSRGYEVSRFKGKYYSNIWGVDDAAGLTAEDVAVLDRLFPVTPDENTPNSFRRARQDFAAAVWAAVPEGAWTARSAALEAANRVPVGMQKEDWLPFVTATLHYFDESQGEAIERDETAASFALADQQIRYLADFRRLTGRDFDPEADRVTREEIESHPVTPPAPSRPTPDVECLECGATYPPQKAHLIDAGGMGCVRCNH